MTMKAMLRWLCSLNTPIATGEMLTSVQEHWT